MITSKKLFYLLLVGLLSTNLGMSQGRMKLLNMPEVAFLRDSGVANSNNLVFIHPPRSYAFAITEFNPFPAFRLPMHVGKKWESFIDFPISYLQKAKLKGMIATDPIHFDFAYEVTGQTQIDTKLGLLTCMIIRGVGTSTIGKTASTFYYNEQYGVVDVLYENIDKSNLRIQLEAVNEH